jgi:alginate O-acetyltransferase complex protein AlgI
MLFNSYSFLIFFPIVTILYFLLPYKIRWLHLLIASCIFYMAFIPYYILILFGTIIIDYIAGILIEGASGKKRKQYLLLSIVANVGVLAVFKYLNFFSNNVNHLFGWLHVQASPIPYWNIILPIGLSFHTFQAMSYTIEVYRRNQKAERHFGIYALYVMFYPQLVAGPIERPQNLLMQFHSRHYFNSDKLLIGLRLMLWGFFKKVVIADRISFYVNQVYSNPGDYHYLNLIIATFFFAIQIYCDFSGYSDIAIGAAKTMGFDLMTNFNRPYFSKNIQDFWARWHISLSSWFRDYVYISLGGNRVKISRMYINIAVVFIISGLWHGANWTFIFWGAMNALFIISYMLLKSFLNKAFPDNTFVRAVSILVTFILICMAWIFFRADNLHQAILIIKNIVTMKAAVPFATVIENVVHTQFGLSNSIIAILCIVIMFGVEKNSSPTLINFQTKTFGDIAFCSIILTLIIAFGVFHQSGFIYFQF